MKVGILGGSFNPVHVGHIELARCAKEQFLLDKVVFMPAGNPYQKKGFLPISARIEILEAALDNEFEISTLESDETKPSYSCDTFEVLKKEYPTVSFFLILGYDCLAGLPTWKEPDRLLGNCDIIAAARDGADLVLLKKTADEMMEKYGGQIHVMEFKDIRISSSDIRERISKGESLLGLVPEEAVKLMEEKGYYKDLV